MYILRVDGTKALGQAEGQIKRCTLCGGPNLYSYKIWVNLKYVIGYVIKDFILIFYTI